MKIVTDLGERTAQVGDWIILGEDNERYIVDDAFFQRTFTEAIGFEHLDTAASNAIGLSELQWSRLLLDEHGLDVRESSQLRCQG